MFIPRQSASYRHVYPQRPRRGAKLEDGYLHPTKQLLGY